MEGLGAPPIRKWGFMDLVKEKLLGQAPRQLTDEEYQAMILYEQQQQALREAQALAMAQQQMNPAPQAFDHVAERQRRMRMMAGYE